ncbi:unnamed protein product, partial [Ixodes hexagonus]
KKYTSLQVLESWIKQYGKVFGYYAGETPYIVIADVELIKRCFVRESQIAYDRPLPFVDVEPGTSSLISLAGQFWKNIRAQLNPIFTPAKMKMLTPIVSHCAAKMMEVLDDAVTKEGIVDMDRVARGFSMDVITKSSLAWQVDCQTNTDNPFVARAKKIFEGSDSADVIYAIRFPILRSVLAWLSPFLGYFNVAKEISRDVGRIIELRRKGERPRTTDMLQMMLEAQEGLQDAATGPGAQAKAMEDRHIVSNCVIFVVAGFHTTALSLALVVHMLARHPEEQERVFNELEEALPDEGDLTYDVVQGLKRLDMVVCETLRLYPPVVLFLSRYCHADTTVGGHFFPAGANVVLPTWHIHHNPELWPDPFKFDPERFVNGANAHSAYFPFGIGPRMCIGKRFALLEIKMAVCSLMRKYRIFQCDETQEHVKFHAMPTVLKLENGIYVRLQRR